jgi:hypothetical protein
MLSGSGNNGVRKGILGASTLGAVAALPKSGSHKWLLFTVIAIIVIGLVLTGFKLYAAFERKRK